MKNHLIFTLFISGLFLFSCNIDTNVVDLELDNKILKTENHFSIQKRIELAIKQKSLVGTGLTWLKTYKEDDMGQEIDWKKETPYNYVGYFDLENNVKESFQELQESIVKFDPYECCNIEFVGYSQPDADEDLFLLWAGSGLANDYGLNYSEIFFTAHPACADVFSGDGQGGPDPELWDCPRRAGENVWLAYKILEPGDLPFCGYSMEVRFSKGYLEEPYVPFESFIPICESIQTVNWGTYQLGQ